MHSHTKRNFIRRSSQDTCALRSVCVCVCLCSSNVHSYWICRSDTNTHTNREHTRSTYISAMQSAEPIFGSHLIIRTWEMCSRVPNPMTKIMVIIVWIERDTAPHHITSLYSLQNNKILSSENWFQFYVWFCFFFWYFVFPFRCVLIGAYVREWMKYGLPVNRVHRTIDDETVHTHTYTLAHSLWARENNVPEIVHRVHINLI